MNAVDSEFVNSLSNENSRILQLLIELSKKAHPSNNFFWGNRDSLITKPTKNKTVLALR